MPVLFEAPAETPRKKSPKKVKSLEQKEQTFSRVMTTYLMHPQDIRFETQGEDENVILFLRQHIIVLIPQIILGLVFFFIPVLVFPFLFRFVEGAAAIPGRYVMIMTIFWYEALFGYLLASFIHWYFNIFIVTNYRVIDIDFLYLLYKKFAEAKIEKIQDISFRTGGIVATMFNYGDVFIQTASEVPNFVFEKVPRPSDVVHVVSDLTQGGKGKGNV